MNSETILDILHSKYSTYEIGQGEFYDCDHEPYVTETVTLDDLKEMSLEYFQQHILDFLGIGSIKLVDSYGGEGEGERYYKVFHFEKHDIYIKFEGFYTSYDGVNYFETRIGKEVFPAQKTITVYD